jgi:hypothetical protein
MIAGLCGLIYRARRQCLLAIRIRQCLNARAREVVTSRSSSDSTTVLCSIKHPLAALGGYAAVISAGPGASCAML